MSSLLIKRTSSSSYFSPDFEQLEQNELEKIPGIKYFSTSSSLPNSGEVILITNTHTNLDDWSNEKHRIKAIIHPNSGYDNFLKDYENWKMIPVLLGNSIRMNAVTEWIISSLFHACTPILHHPSWPKNRSWPRKLIKDLNVLLIGFGLIGQEVNKIIKNLVSHITIYDPYKNYDDITHLEKAYDVLIICCELNSTSKDLINKNFFDEQKNSLTIINSARSEIIEMNSLYNFLDNYPNSKCFLDVHENEPLKNNFYEKYPQIISTPHQAGVWINLERDIIKFNALKIKEWLNNKNDIPSTWEQDLLSYKLRQWSRK